MSKRKDNPILENADPQKCANDSEPTNPPNPQQDAVKGFHLPTPLLLRTSHILLGGFAAAPIIWASAFGSLAQRNKKIVYWFFSFVIEKKQALDVVMKLDAAGIARGGDLASSPPLKRMGVTIAVRVYCYVYTTTEEINQLIAVLKRDCCGLSRGSWREPVARCRHRVG